MDVKKLGRIPDGGGWRAHGRAVSRHQRRTTPRSATTTSTPSSMTTPGSPTPRSCPMRRHHLRGVPAPRRRLLRRPRHPRHRAGDHRQRLRPTGQLRLGLRRAQPRRPQKFIHPHCPWQNGKVERLNRTLPPNGPTDSSSPATPNAPPPSPWLEHYNTRRRHSALGGLPPISRLHQRHDRVQLAGPGAVVRRTAKGSVRRGSCVSPVSAVCSSSRPDEERERDLLGSQAAQGAEGQRHLCLERERGGSR